MSQTVFAEFELLPGKGAEFVSLLLPALADTRAFDGCEGIETYTDQDNPDRVVLWEKWAARSNHEAYMAWRMETGMMDIIGPFIAGPPRFIYMSAAE